MDPEHVFIADDQVFFLAEFVGQTYLSSKETGGGHILALFTSLDAARDFVSITCPNMAEGFVYPCHDFAWIKEMARGRYTSGSIDPVLGTRQKTFGFEPTAMLFIASTPDNPVHPPIPKPSLN